MFGIRKRTWKPAIDGWEHVVELVHGGWPGTQEMRVG
jgi:hypothetical protein